MDNIMKIKTKDGKDLNIKMKPVKTVKGVKIPISARIYSFLKNHTKFLRFIVERAPDITLIACVYIVLYLVFGFTMWKHYFLAVSIYFLYKEIISDIIKIKISGGKK